MRSVRARFPLRGLSLVVFAVFVGGAAAGSGVARRALADQERHLLKQRAGEAAALLGNVLTQSEASIRSLAAVTSATDGGADAFTAAADRDPAFGRPNVTVALVQPSADGNDRFRVTATHGSGLTAGQLLDGPAATLAARALGSDGVVTSPVFATAADGTRRLASALRVGSDAASPLIYREAVLPPAGQRRLLTATEPFGEIEAVLYAGPQVDPAEVVLATRTLPLPGPTVHQTITVGPDRWLLIVAANRSLVGGLAAKEPWLLLFRGLVAALLVTALVEVLSRRRRYALALVDERTSVLREQEQQFRDLLETAPDGIVIVDGEGRIVLVNRQTERLFGWSRDQLVGQTIEMLLPDRFAQRHADNRRAFSGDP
ncbi:MAG TPA: PAS domain S-box protein, partial [Acidimicrobiia bacterium]|nr:PAS domain S-box protein [Acidimicrobiia bacterium]